MKKVLLFFFALFFSSFTPVNAQVSFDDYPENPVFSYSGQSGTFDQTRVYTQDVIKVGDEYKMFYSGVGVGNSVQIGLATSVDGIEWHRAPQNPVFKCGENSSVCLTGGIWSHFRVYVVSVEYKNGEYRMWYQGNNQNLKPIQRLGFATSSDGINWTASNLNPVFTAEERNGIRYLSVLPTQKGYRLYYADGVDQGLYYLDSVDGLDWVGKVTKIADTRAHSVDKLGAKYVAVFDTSIFASDDGVEFDLSEPVGVVSNTPNTSDSRMSFMEDGELIKVWKTNFLGNITWAYGNFAIDYSTADKEEFYSEFEEYEDEELSSEYPLYTQIQAPVPPVFADAVWADNVMPCGKIKECGCAITSLIMAGRSRGITEGVDGSDVNPGSLNEWLLEHGGYDKVGNVYWSKAADYFGQKVGDDIATPLSVENHKVLNQAAIIGAVEDEGKEVLGNSYRYGHFFTITGLINDGYSIKDPLWYETTSTNEEKDVAHNVQDYDDTVDRGVVYSFDEAKVQTGIIEATLNSPAEILLVDEEGNRSGFVAGEVVEEIEHSGYLQNEFVRSRELEPGEVQHETKHLLATKAAGVYELRVIGTGEGEYTLGMHIKTEDGSSKSYTFIASTTQGAIDVYVVNLRTGEVSLQPVSEEVFMEVLDEEIPESILNRFFRFWIEKIFTEIGQGNVQQIEQHLTTFEVLLKAKKVESSALWLMLDKLREEI